MDWRLSFLYGPNAMLPGPLQTLLRMSCPNDQWSGGYADLCATIHSVLIHIVLVISTVIALHSQWTTYNIFPILWSQYAANNKQHDTSSSFLLRRICTLLSYSRRLLVKAHQTHLSSIVIPNPIATPIYILSKSDKSASFSLISSKTTYKWRYVFRLHSCFCF